jgi:hypothetical protein
MTNLPPNAEHASSGLASLTEDYIRYGLRDVQTTWECFDALAQRFATFGLAETGLYDLYSEASLGRAYLKTMNIKPWREVQPDFPPKLIGHILSAYYGGRSEVHIRRQIVPVIHTDYLSMYPMVCTLMGLWEFVRANGVMHSDDSQAIRELLASPRDGLVERLRRKEGWTDLTVLAQVLLDRNLFPVRAQYPEGETATIGMNHLSSDKPLWFTLADVLASKILTGRTPKVLPALRFEPLEKQEDLRSVAVAGKRIDPATEDFYQHLIMHRNILKARADDPSEPNRSQFESDQKSVKILANATSERRRLRRHQTDDWLWGEAPSVQIQIEEI